MCVYPCMPIYLCTVISERFNFCKYSKAINSYICAYWVSFWVSKHSYGQKQMASRNTKWSCQ